MESNALDNRSEAKPEYIDETSESVVQRPSAPSGSECSIWTPPALSQRYRFIREIGHGAQGHIYLAEHLNSHTRVSVKQFNIHSVKTWKEYDLFRREAQVLASLHINGVAHFYEAVERLDDDPPCSFIIQEFIEGDSLQSMIKRGHRFSMADICDIVIQLLCVLDGLHNHIPPVIHRDIKPSNLMLTPIDGGGYHLTVIDFGAVSNPQIQGGGSTVAGTFGYMPPEQMTGHTVPASDIYAVGAVAVQLFTGKAPTEMDVQDFRIIFEPEMEDKPHALVATLRKMLDPNVESRLADIHELIDLFQKFKASQFELQNRTVEDVPYEPTFQDKLLEVKFIGQEGNLQLWNRLPDTTNRNPIVHYPSAIQYPRKDQEYCAFEDKAQVSARNRAFSAVAFVMATWGFFIAFLLTIIPLTALETFLFVLLMSIPCLLVAFVEYNRQKVNHTQPFHPSLVHHDDYHSVIPPGKETIDHLIQFGHKAVATIVEIKYICTPDCNVEDNPLGKLRKNVAHRACHGKPSFVIRYKFNPPDDIRKEDLFHNYITYGEPDYHYRVGDRLPILYLIQNNYYNQVVSSMPFPVPVDDLCQAWDIVYRSYAVDTRQEHLNTYLCFDVSLDYALDQLPTETARKLGALNSEIRLLKPKKTLTRDELYRIDRALSILITDDELANEKLIPYLTYFLSSHKFHELHQTVMSVLIRMAFPERKLSDKLFSRNKPLPAAERAIEDYLAQKPRSYVLPSFGAIVELTHVYNRGDLPEDMLRLLFQICMDHNANPELRQQLSRIPWPEGIRR